MSQPALFPPRVLSRFIETFPAEIGKDAFKSILLKSELPEEWAQAAHFAKADPLSAAQAYARLQAAVRLYYGRGARGILLRVGSKMWSRLLQDSGLKVKAQAALLRALPAGSRRKGALDLLARLLSASADDASAHTHDLDLLFVDRVSPTALGQTESAPICFVTLGLIRECLFWADGREHDVEETACRAAGAHQCEFKIIVGG